MVDIEQIRTTGLAGGLHKEICHVLSHDKT